MDLGISSWFISQEEEIPTSFRNRNQYFPIVPSLWLSGGICVCALDWKYVSIQLSQPQPASAAVTLTVIILSQLFDCSVFKDHWLSLGPTSWLVCWHRPFSSKTMNWWHTKQPGVSVLLCWSRFSISIVPSEKWWNIGTSSWWTQDQHIPCQPVLHNVYLIFFQKH